MPAKEMYTLVMINTYVSKGGCHYDGNRFLYTYDLYDKSGNLVRKLNNGKTTEYKYDARNLLLVEVDNANGSYVKYGYDALGRKVFREEAQVDLDKLEA